MSKIQGGEAFSVDPPKALYFLCNSFSLRLRENLHKQKHFLKGVHVLFITFFSKMCNFFFIVNYPLKPLPGQPKEPHGTCNIEIM